MTPLSVVIITLNEERNIGRCLESVRDIADDIVVVDSCSSDATKAICDRFNVRFIQHEWEGYSDQKNFANSQAANDWILSLDADEALSPELQQSIKVLRANSTEPKEYCINRLVNYCGAWIRHGGWYPDVKLRLFDRRTVKWSGRIHEILEGSNQSKAPLLQGDCFHYTYYTIEEHLKQAQHFSSLAAAESFESGKSAHMLSPSAHAVAKFIRDYLFRLGFLDGRSGFQIAWISARAAAWKYKKLRDLYHR